MSAQPAKKRAQKKTVRQKPVNDTRIVTIDGRDRRP